MKQANKEMQEDMSDSIENATFPTPNNFGFKFVYTQAIAEDYAEDLVNSIKLEQEE